MSSLHPEGPDMLEPRKRRHPVQTFQFWFIVLTCFGVGTAWKLDLFTSSTETERLPVMDDEPMPPPPVVHHEKNSLPQVRRTAPDVAMSARLPALSENAPLPPALDLTGSPHSQTAAATAAPLPPPHQPEEVETAESVAAMPPQSSGVTEYPTDELPDVSELKTAAAEIVQVHNEQIQQKPLPSTSPSAPTAAPEETLDVSEADRLIDAGNDVAAHRLLSGWYWQHPAQRAAFEERLKFLSARIYLRPDRHYLAPHVIQFGEQLESIAAATQVTPEYLARLNHLVDGELQPGTKLKVIQGPFGAVVDLSEFSLTVHAHGYYVVRFPIGLGQDQSAPTGTFHVVDKRANPVYHGAQGAVSGDDPENPLGEHWLAISDQQGTLHGFGIHGTSHPEFIGTTAPQGNICLKESDAAALFDLLTVGAEVIIRQ